MHALLADAGVEDRARLEQAVERQPRELGLVRGERVLDLGEPRAVERRDQRREREIGPDAPQPERRSAARTRLERAPRGAADELVRVMPVVRRRRAHECGIELGEQLPEQLHEPSSAAARSSPAESASGGSHVSSSKPARRQASSTSARRRWCCAGRPSPQATLTMRQPASRSAISVAGAPATRRRGGERDGGRCGPSPRAPIPR